MDYVKAKEGGIYHKPSEAYGKTWEKMVMSPPYCEWFRQNLPNCCVFEGGQEPFPIRLYHKGIDKWVTGVDDWGAVSKLMRQPEFVAWLKNMDLMFQPKEECGMSEEWTAKRCKDGWVNVTHEPTGMSISSMFDVKDCVQTITSSDEYVDYVTGSVPFKEDDLKILYRGGWYLHVPTGKTAKSLEGLLSNLVCYLTVSKEFIFSNGDLLHKPSGLRAMSNLLLSDQFVSYVEKERVEW